MTDEQLSEKLFESTTELVTKAVLPLLARIASLETQLKAIPAGPKGDPGVDGKDGAPGRDGVDGKDGAPGLPGEKGLDGKDGANGKDGRDGVDGKNGVDGLDGKDGAPGLPGEKGLDGKDGTNGKDGRDGLDGKDGVDGVNGKDGAPGKDGEKGLDGKDGRDGVDGKDGKPGDRGEKGDAGRDGKDGEHGRDAAAIHVLSEIDPAKSYPRGTFAQHLNGFWYAATKTVGMEGWLCLAPGINDVELVQDSERSFSVRVLMSDGRSSQMNYSMPVVIYRDVYRPETKYKKGDAVTFGGHLWIALTDEPTDKPGVPVPPGQEQWRLAVKRGRDGKDK